MAARNGSATVSTFSYANSAEVYTIGTVLPAVCIGVVALRFFTRRLQRVGIGVDDWLSLGGATMLLGMGICFIVGAATGSMGEPTPPLPGNLTTQAEILNYDAPDPNLVGKLEFAIQMQNVVCYGFVKLSILAFYRRIFVVSERSSFDIATRVMAVVVFLWTITFILLVIFACPQSVSASWGTAAQQNEYCLAIGYTSLEGLAGSDLILDLILISMPIVPIWRLHMSLPRKLAVTGIMMLGAASIGASVARLVLYVQTQSAKIAHIPVDFDQIITLDMFWSMLESGLALIASCLPTLSYLFTGYGSPRLGSSLLRLTRFSQPRLGSEAELRRKRDNDSLHSRQYRDPLELDAEPIPFAQGDAEGSLGAVQQDKTGGLPTNRNALE